MVIRRVGPLSVAKIAALLYAIFGLIIGAFITLFALVGAAFTHRYGSAGYSPFFGVAAIIVCPILYSGLGFIMSLIGAALYNLAAGWVGGIELEVQ